MSNPSDLEPCARCGAIVPGGTEGCHALFAEVLALEYTDPSYAAAHLLTVDAHALQHSEDHGVKNNAFHLIRLCWILEHGGDPRIGQGPRWLQVQFDGLPEVPALEPPARRGEVTVADVHGASGPEDHVERVRRWARSVWEAWNDHHAWARGWLRERGRHLSLRH